MLLLTIDEQLIKISDRRPVLNMDFYFQISQNFLSIIPVFSNWVSFIKKLLWIRGEIFSVNFLQKLFSEWPFYYDCQ